MKIKPLHLLGPVIGLLLFVGALWVLRGELHHYRYRDVVNYLRDLPRLQVALAIFFTAVSYALLTGYDILAFRYIEHDLHYLKVAFASFIGYSFSHSVGQSLITGGSIRYRLYSAWGLSAIDITKVVAFCVLTFWIGWVALTGGALLFDPPRVPPGIPFPDELVRPLGVLLLGIAAAYLAATYSKQRTLNLRGFELAMPSPKLAIAQIILSAVDLAATGAVLYFLLPASISLSFMRFLGVFLIASLAGSASQIPGGLGVFETTMIVSLSSRVSSSVMLGALLVYRAIYYVLPLGAAALMLAANEIHIGKKHIAGVARIVGAWGPMLTPHVLAFTTFVGGAVLLFSGATPAVTERLKNLEEFLPLSVLEFSHFLSSLVGVGLLLLAYGLQRRLDAAYHLTVMLLSAGIVFSLLKALDVEEALILTAMLVALFPCRKAFYRKASVLSERMTPGWIVAVIIVVLASFGLGSFSHKHVDYSGELWWQFTLNGHAPRFLRASVGVGVVALVFALAKLIRPAYVRHAIPPAEQLSKALEIVRQSSRTSDNLALLGDKSFLFNEDGNAFIMYAIERRSWVSMGDPVGPKEEWQELLWDFRELSDRHDGRPVFYQADPETLSLYLELGLTPLKIGEEARVSLEGYSLEGSERRDERYSVRHAEKDGCSFEVVDSAEVKRLMPELRAISDCWLREKNTREKRFSMGSFNEDYLGQFSVCVVRREGRIVAFANLWLGAEKEELSIDLMRHSKDAPSGIMDYLFIKLMLWGAEQGYEWFNLGMAPLAGLESRALAPLWNRVGGLVFRHGEHFYNFQGLRDYKDKFNPVWRPKYLVSRAGLSLPRILTNVASLISGGVRGVLAK